MSTPPRRAAAIARRSGGSPACQPPVPARIRPRRRARAAPPRRGRRASASGERQILPRQTNRIAVIGMHASLVAKARRSASQMQRQEQSEGIGWRPRDRRGCRAGADPGQRLWLVRPVRPRPGLHHQFRRPADHLDPRPGHQADLHLAGRPDRLPLRHRLRGLLRLVRDPARPARGQLVSRPADRDRPRLCGRR